MLGDLSYWGFLHSSEFGLAISWVRLKLTKCPCIRLYVIENYSLLRLIKLFGVLNDGELRFGNVRCCFRGPIIAALRAVRHVYGIETRTRNIQRIIVCLIMIVKLQCCCLSEWRSLIYIIVHQHSVFEVMMSAHSSSRIWVILIA